MLMVEMKRMMKMRDYCVLLMPFFPNRLFVTAQKSKEHGHELRPPCRKKVTQSRRWKWPMANVGILEQIWRVEPIWSTTLILIRICDPHTEQLQLTPAQGELITTLRVQLLITALG